MTTTTDPPASLAAALAQLQTRLPTIAKTSKAQYGNYADLADVSRELLPIMGELGLSFSAKPTWVTRPDGTKDFVLAYRLRHVSGEYDEGEYALGNNPTNHQALGSAITYGRRYSLCAITGAVAEDDDDGERASQPQPAARRQRGAAPIRPLEELPRNQDGSLSRSKCTEAELAHYGAMDSGQQKQHNKLERAVLGVNSDGQSPPSTDRLGGTPPEDPWLLADPAVRPLRAPVPAGNPRGVIFQHFNRLEYGDTPEDRTARIKVLSTITGRAITSTNDLTAAEGVKVIGVLSKARDHAALAEALAVMAGEDIA